MCTATGTQHTHLSPSPSASLHHQPLCTNTKHTRCSCATLAPLQRAFTHTQKHASARAHTHLDCIEARLVILGQPRWHARRRAGRNLRERERERERGRERERESEREGVCVCVCSCMCVFVHVRTCVRMRANLFYKDVQTLMTTPQTYHTSSECSSGGAWSSPTMTSRISWSVTSSLAGVPQRAASSLLSLPLTAELLECASTRSKTPNGNATDDGSCACKGACARAYVWVSVCAGRRLDTGMNGKDPGRHVRR